MSERPLAEILRDCGVVGAGGAGFPAYAKLTAAKDLSVLIVNGSECEPLLYTDYFLLRERLPEITEGVRLIMERARIPEATLCLKARHAEALGLADGQVLGEGIRVRRAPDVYPVGDEVNLIYAVTGRLVPPGDLPASVGAVVYNVETVYNIGRAIRESRPVTEKWLTVGGATSEAYCVRAPIGAPVSEVLAHLRVTVGPGQVVLDGGPSMGRIVDPATATVGKTTNALLVLPETIRAVALKRRSAAENLRMAASLCCQCSRCTDLCPRRLLGYPLEPHRLVRATLSAAQETPELVRTAALCSLCGVCAEFACCQDISPVQVIRSYREILQREHLRYPAASDPASGTPWVGRVNPDRAYRMVSADKWGQTLGVDRFDRLPVLVPDRIPATRVEIPLFLQTGAPSLPAVSVGDEVEEGQRIAEAAEGLSLPQHASIPGRVVRADASRVVIEGL